MADQNDSNTPPEAAGEIPQAVAEELAQLDAELGAMERKAARSWRTTAIGYLVLLAFIASYLGFGVYHLVKEYLKEDSLVQMAFEHVDSILKQHGVPHMEDAALVSWAVKQLEAQAPNIMEKAVKPYLLKNMKKLPDWRKQAIEQVKTNGPGYADKGVAAAKQNLLPAASKWLVERGVSQAKSYLDKVQPKMDAAVEKIIETHKQDIKDLAQKPPEKQVAAMKQAIEKSMEEQFSPLLDPMFEKIAYGLDTTRTGLKDLIHKMNSGTLTHEEDLEIGAVQLTYALFKLRAAPDQTGLSLWDRIQSVIQQSTKGKPGAVPAVNVTPVSAKAETAQELQGKITSLEEALKAPGLSDAQRKQMQEQVDAAKTLLKRQQETTPEVGPALGSGASAAAAMAAATTPEAKMAVLKGEIRGLQKALDNPKTSQRAKPSIKAQLEETQKKLDALKAQAKQ